MILIYKDQKRAGSYVLPKEEYLHRTVINLILTYNKGSKMHC